MLEHAYVKDGGRCTVLAALAIAQLLIRSKPAVAELFIWTNFIAFKLCS
jgi:hypothetical protein